MSESQEKDDSKLASRLMKVFHEMASSEENFRKLVQKSKKLAKKTVKRSVRKGRKSVRKSVRKGRKSVKKMMKRR